MICDGNGEPETADNIAGYVACCHEDYPIAEVKKELSVIAGCEPDGLALFTFKGWKRIANYETVQLKHIASRIFPI